VELIFDLLGHYDSARENDDLQKKLLLLYYVRVENRKDPLRSVYRSKLCFLASSSPRKFCNSTSGGVGEFCQSWCTCESKSRPGHTIVAVDSSSGPNLR
jgi:hypothetical protein